MIWVNTVQSILPPDNWKCEELNMSINSQTSEVLQVKYSSTQVIFKELKN